MIKKEKKQSKKILKTGRVGSGHNVQCAELEGRLMSPVHIKNNTSKTGRVQTARRSWETQQQQLPQFPTLKIPKLC